MALIRSIIHTLWMLITVIPWAIIMLLASTRVRGKPLYWMAARWLGWAMDGARVILGIRSRVTGMENLPVGETSAAVLLVKHQSTCETFLMPTLMPHPLAYVFKKELLQVPFFGWAMGRLDMIHIDRNQRAQAFSKVVEQGRQLLAQGVWIIMFPEGTRIARACGRGSGRSFVQWPDGARTAAGPGDCTGRFSPSRGQSAGCAGWLHRGLRIQARQAAHHRFCRRARGSGGQCAQVGHTGGC